jgi:hypothetical protein
MKTKQEMINYLYDSYKFSFPMKAKYKRDKNRIYFATDFQDGEEIEFWWNCDKPSSSAKGYAFYTNGKADFKLVNINELIPI